MSTAQKTPFDLPSLTLLLDLANVMVSAGVTELKFQLMQIMEAVTDKPNWDTKPMIDYIFRELEWKASEYAKTGIVTAFDPGVVKSDTAIPQDLQKKHRAVVKPLEDISDEEKDYHPTSCRKAVDLAHPSLFPLVYGRTRVLRDKSSELTTVLTASGKGAWRVLQRMNMYSERFQWLPCNVKFGPNGECQIASYINNLHPARHKNLYHIIEQIITRTMPLWNDSVSYLSDEEPEPEYDGGEDYDERYEEWQNRRQPKRLQPCPFQPPYYCLANIELTPDKPDYGGRAWHIEDSCQDNERICATAIYYYDSENITEKVNYEQEGFQFLRVFGFDSDAGRDDYEQITQDLCRVLCRMGRLLTFPNTLQHRVSPFSLADRSKPGHGKILALFLIDPSRRIVSTANIPPQRGDWSNYWTAATKDVLDSRAKAYRVELMAERSSKSESENELFTWGGFSLCEH
ncbi:hypothetical protein BDW60DRAFT_215784 [Aspergillus nidulans var. acristatus]